MDESPEEKEALDKLEDEVDDVVWGEFDKEEDRELAVGRGPIARSDRRRSLFGRWFKKDDSN